MCLLPQSLKASVPCVPAGKAKRQQSVAENSSGEETSANLVHVYHDLLLELTLRELFHRIASA